jgi:hypothetical protein
VFPIQLTATAIIVAVAALVVVAGAVVLVSVPHVRRTVVQERRRLSRPGDPAWLRLPYELVPLLIGAIGYVELRRRGGLSAGERLDPLVVAVPTLLLIGAAVLIVRLMVWGSRLLDRASD